MSLSFGLTLGLLTFLSIWDSAAAWDLGLDAALLWVGTLNALYGTVDIYDDTIERTDARSDAYRCAALYPGMLTPKCVGGSWFVIALGAFCTWLPPRTTHPSITHHPPPAEPRHVWIPIVSGMAVYGYLALEEASSVRPPWWAFLPGPIALSIALLARSYELYHGSTSRGGSFSFSFCLRNLLPRAQKRTKTATAPTMEITQAPRL